MKQTFKFLLFEYRLELAALVFGSLVLLIVGVTIADLWHVILPIVGSALGLAEGILLILLFLAIYFLPTLIAKKRKHRNLLAIFILNLCLSPVGVGWVVALVWACLKQEARI